MTYKENFIIITIQVVPQIYSNRTTTIAYIIKVISFRVLYTGKFWQGNFSKPYK